MLIREMLETKVYKECDVLVCGGGFGGISIALTNGDFTEAQAEKVADAFEAKFGKRPKYFKTTIGTGAGLVG